MICAIFTIYYEVEIKYGQSKNDNEKGTHPWSRHCDISNFCQEILCVYVFVILTAEESETGLCFLKLLF